MLKIATHNSGTGEKPLNFLSWLLIPFARTQSKSIKEQYDAGARMFDIRIKMHKDRWHVAHGLFVTKRTFEDIIEEINSFDDPCYVSITYEGRLDTDKSRNIFIDYVKAIQITYSHINWGSVAVKYTNKDLIVDWEIVIPGQKWDRGEQGFIPLDGKHWQTYLPIPWLWNLIYTRKHEFNEEYFIYVDFL